MTNVFFYLVVGVLSVAFALRVPRLLRHWRDPLVRSVSLLLPLGAAVFFFAAPPTIAQVNTLTGIANFSAPLVYCIVTVASAALIHLTITWRGGPEDRRQAATRWCVGAYAVVCAGQLTLFALGDAPDERLRDFDTYYATTPYLREMIVLSLLAYGAAIGVLGRLCWRWSREVTGLLRTGLVLIVTGAVLGLGYVACKLLAIGARWAGHDWDGVSTALAPNVSFVASLCQCVGFVLPSVGQGLTGWWRRWSQYRRLRPLWLTMREVTPYELVRIPWWSSLGRRHLRRTCDIRDGLRLLSPCTDRDGRQGGQGHTTRPGAVRPEAARHVSMVTTALRTMSGIHPDDADGHLESMLAGDDHQLVRLSEALRVLAVPRPGSDHTPGSPAVPQTAAIGGPHPDSPPAHAGHAER